MKNRILKLLLSCEEKKIAQMWIQMVDLIRKFTEPIRKGRQFPENIEPIE